MNDLKLLVTGASGFIGSFIVEEGLARGYEVWAAVRKSSSREFLTDGRIHFVELDLLSEERLTEQLRGHRFDFVVHAAGLTKSLKDSDFYRVNTLGTQNLTNVIKKLQMPLRRFIYLSSLSIFGPIREEQPYTEITETDTPRPNTDYGRSKLLAEEYLQREASFPYVVLRPTGVYGPREKDYFMMAKSIKGHVDFAVGFKRQDITFVYVKDVVQAVFLAFERGESGRKYFLSDGQVYQSSAFSDLIREELGNPWCLRLTAPVWLLRVVTACGDSIGKLTGKISALNNDKYHILRQRNWRCDISPATDELGYQPEYPLERGVRETIAWYKENKWL
ncbi:MAG: NAD-dependent epimerase/dehydratase family protein [Prevotella sp.]|nr:NAD-dependent epimerase/dehydratase family protein [Prevotella sp.]MBR7042632.1 NAD-dependent epimerase/dehydratase family protein [Prevotella sp.]